MHELVSPWALLRVGACLAVLTLPGLALATRLLPDTTGPRRVAIGAALALALQLLLALLLLFTSHTVLLVVLAVASILALPVAIRGLLEGTGWRVPLVAALVFFVGGIATTRPVTVWSDAIDHVATARAIAATGELEPNTVFYADGDGETPDIRKGYYHVAIATVARATGLPAMDAWVALRPFALATGAFSLAVFAGAFLPPVATAIAVGFAPFLVHGNAAWFWDTFLYPHNADWLLLWPALLLVLGLLRGDRPGAGRTLAILAAALPGMHVFAPVLLWTGTGALLLGALAFGHRRACRRGARALVIVVVAAIPALVVRLLRSHHPVNPLHIEHSEVFYLTSWLTLHPPEPLFTMFSPPAVLLAFASILWLGRGARASVTRAALVGLAWVPLLLTFNPLAGAVLQPVIKYLFIRFLGLVPYPLLAAVALYDAGRSRRPVPIAVAVGVALLVLLQVPRTLALGEARTARRDAAQSPETWREAYALVTESLGKRPETILTDPMTGYALPAYAPHHVVAVLDQHSSPSDPSILTRLDDVARALSPYRPIQEAIDVLERRNATYVLVNGAFTRPMESHFDVRVPDMAAATRARFESRPALFERVGESGECVLFRWTGRVPVEAEAPPTPPAASFAPPDSVWLHPVVSLVGIALSPPVLTPGDTLEVRLGLRKQADDEPADAYRVVVRGRLDLREANDVAHRFERLYTRLAGATGRSLEFVSNRRPLDGRYPIRLWDVGDAFEDVFSIALPSDLEPGRYRVGVSLHRQQLVRNIALRDWLRPRGGIGVHVADVEVRAATE